MATATAGRRVRGLEYPDNSTEAPFAVDSTEVDFSGDAVAVLISIADDVASSFDATTPQLPKFRVVVSARPADGEFTSRIQGPAAAYSLARRIIDETRTARAKYRPGGEVHVFAAIPAGLAVLIGQMSNTLGALNIYEHAETAAVSPYAHSVRIPAASS